MATKSVGKDINILIKRTVKSDIEVIKLDQVNTDNNIIIGYSDGTINKITKAELMALVNIGYFKEVSLQANSASMNCKITAFKTRAVNKIHLVLQFSTLLISILPCRK